MLVEDRIQVIQVIYIYKSHLKVYLTVFSKTVPKISQYNFGWIGNLRRYGRLQPPEYDLSKVTAPVYIIHGENDYFATPKASHLINYCSSKNSFLV